MTNLTITEKQKQRFWSKVDVRGPEECWPWMGWRTEEHGYGLIFVGIRPKAQQVRAHRISYFLEHGYWPNVCRHTCDYPPCVNPAHLLDGTKADNARDMVERGRQAKGERHPCWGKFGKESRTFGRKASDEERALLRSVRKRGEENNKAKLKERNIPYIRFMYKRGFMSQHELAARFGVYQTTIWSIVHRKSWTHI